MLMMLTTTAASLLLYYIFLIASQVFPRWHCTDNRSY